MMSRSGMAATCHAVPARKFRVLHIIKTSELSGMPSYVLSIIRNLDRDLFESTVICPPDGPLVEDLKKLGVPAITIEIERYGFSLLKDIHAFLEILQVVKRGDFHIIHSHGSKSGLYNRIATKIAGVPLSIHTVHLFSFHESQNPVLNKFFVICERVMAKMTDHIITVSKHLQMQAVSLKIAELTKITAIPNGVPLARFGNAAPTKILERHVDVEESAPVIGTVGRLVEQKGHKDLLEAFQNVQKRIPRTKLVLVGDGPLRQRLERLAKALEIRNCVQFLGTQRNVEDILKTFSIFVLPSYWEGLPLALMEAMASGIPVVATDIAAHREIVTHEENGVLTPVGEPKRLADSIIYVLSNPEKAHLMGANARQTIFEKHDETLMVRAIQETYMKLLKRKGFA